MKKSVPKSIDEDPLRFKFRSKLKLEYGRKKEVKWRGKRTVRTSHSF